MQRHRVELLPSAQADIDAALDYFMDKDLQAAAAFLDDLDRALKQLAAFPETASFSKDARLAQRGYRVLLIEYGYLMFYRIIRDTVCIFRVIDGRRNYGAFL